MSATSALRLAVAGLILAGAVARAGEQDGRLDIYWTDVEGGAATLLVTPAGESVLIDAGLPGERDPDRIVATVRERAGLERIDHMVVTHFDIDHYGGVADLAAKLPIVEVYDPGLPAGDAELMERLADYLLATAGKRQILRPGDAIPLRALPEGNALSLRCLVANQQFIEADRAAPENPHCADAPARADDLSQNANSIVLVCDFGPFRFFDGGDLTWNLEARLVCPGNLVGTVDVFQSDHHGLSSSNNPVLVRSLEPRVVVFNNGARKGCSPESFRTVRETPSVEAIYQLHRNIRSGPEGNTFPRRIANTHERCTAEIVALSVAPDGSSYEVRIPSRGLVESFETDTRTAEPAADGAQRIGE
jgi:beta-lactamase superfamily II metal-dependent hydrolase